METNCWTESKFQSINYSYRARTAAIRRGRVFLKTSGRTRFIGKTISGFLSKTIR